ncbi:MAG TPA: hypothetical protein VME42_14745 [Steroidobacteraceae bacterium]|nr:hypothetical protein [Steroidobacteraceae bacterium]
MASAASAALAPMPGARRSKDDAMRDVAGLATAAIVAAVAAVGAVAIAGAAAER